MPRFTRRHFLSLLGGLAVWVGSGLPLPLRAQGGAMATLPGVLAGGGIDPDALRKELMLRDGLLYLNAGTLGPVPRGVMEQAMAAWRQCEQEPANEGYGALLTAMEGVRTRAARFLGCAVEELALTRGATDGMNLIAQGVDLQPGQHVLTTSHEHPGGREGWAYFAGRRGVVIDEVVLPVPPPSPAWIVDAFAQRMTKDTRVISVSHVTFTNGLRLPIRELAELAKAHDALLVVDGAQGPGGIAVDVAALECHAYATSAHKWMLAPRGTGLLYISKAVQKRIQPLSLQAGYGAYSGAVGTRDIPAVIGLGAAIDLLTALGPEAIERHALRLREQLAEGARAVPGVTVLSPPAGPQAAPIITFGLPAAVNTEALAGALREKHRVVVKVVPDHYLHGIRLSPHAYTSEADVTRVLAALKQELG